MDIFPPDQSVGSDPIWLTRFGNEAFFTADDGIHGPEIWRTDGTPEGTSLFLDMIPGSEGSFANSFQPFGDKLFFFGRTAEHGNEPRVTDGTPEGTVLLTDILEGPADSAWGGVPSIEFEGRLFFTALQKLFATDGTPEGTVELINGADGFFLAGGDPFAGITDAGLLAFGYDSSLGMELFRIDGTGKVELVVDIVPGMGSGVAGTSAAQVGDLVLFAGNDGVGGIELWKSDGTAEGTELVADLLPGAGSSNPDGFEPLGERTLLLARDGSSKLQLFATDGTTLGTEQLGSFPGGVVQGLRAADDHAVFVVNGANGGQELWRTDGTPAGTVFVERLREGGFPIAELEMERAGSGSTVLFPNDDGVHGEEVWRTDGTAAGTNLLVDLAPLGQYAYPKDFLRLGNRVLFSADGGSVGRELFAVAIEPLGEFVAEPFGPADDGAPELSAVGEPRVSQPFALEVLAGASVPGVLAFSSGFGFEPLADGQTLLLDPGSLGFAGFVTGGDGVHSLPIQATPDLAGVQVTLQAIVVEQGSVLASRGLELVIGS